MGGRTKGGLKRNKNAKLSLNQPATTNKKKARKKCILVVGRQAREAKRRHERIKI